MNDEDENYDDNDDVYCAQTKISSVFAQTHAIIICISDYHWIL